MDVRRYFRVYGNSRDGEGFAYYEFIGETCMRQVEEVGANWRAFERDFSRRNPDLCDQPLSVVKFTPDEEISRDEFEAVWKQATLAQK